MAVSEHLRRDLACYHGDSKRRAPERRPRYEPLVAYGPIMGLALEDNRTVPVGLDRGESVGVACLTF